MCITTGRCRAKAVLGCDHSKGVHSHQSQDAAAAAQGMAGAQDVAPVDAGKVLGLTNSCGTVVGVLANIVAGRLAAAHNGYALLFGSMAVLYLIATFTWLALAKGEEVHFNVGAA